MSKPGARRTIPQNVKRAIKSGPKIRWRHWRDLPTEQLRTGEKVCRFIENFLCVPEGDLVGEPMRLLDYQEIFILSIFDGPRRARRALLSIGRKGGKTALIACLLLAFMLMKGILKHNSRINSGALSKEQAALVFGYMQKIINVSPRIAGKCRVVPSGKRINALATNIEYQALSAQANTAMGLSPVVLCGDEWGQVTGPKHSFIDALLTAQGAHKEPLSIVISTQAANDGDWLSLQIDDAIRNPQEDTVCHLYEADPELPLDSVKAWKQACPAMGIFRSRDDMERQAQEAIRLPSAQSRFENLILNRRVSVLQLFLAASVWKQNSQAPDRSVFADYGVDIGLDLSKRNDLTVAVLAAKDHDDVIHLRPYCFTPLNTVEERVKRDKNPYDDWIKDGYLIGVPGEQVDYEYVTAYLKKHLEEENILIRSIQFDRWRIKELEAAAERTGFAQDMEIKWCEIGQGYRDMAPRLDAFEGVMLQRHIRHGAHPLLTMAASQMVVMSDPSGNRKPDKTKPAHKIDPLVAAIMAAYPQISNTLDGGPDVSTWI